MNNSESVNYLYFDKKGKPCNQENAVLCVLQYIDCNGKVIRETEIEISDFDEQ